MSKVVRLAVGTDDNSVVAIVSLKFQEDSSEDDAARVLANAMAHALTRFVEGPHEEAVT